MEERGELRWTDGDPDEYEEEDGDGYGYDDHGDEGEEEEEEEEEEEGYKPTQEELDYLKTRERLKEQIRQKYRKENGTGPKGVTSSEKRRGYANNAEFGSFFGPSQPVIARRVIEESHSLRETRHITSRTPNSGSISKSSPVIANGERKIRAPKNEVKTKAEALKDMRDYSFLFSDDSDLLAPKDDPATKILSTSYSTQAPSKGKIPVNRPHGPVPAGPGLNKSDHLNHHTQARAGLSKLSLESRSKSSTGRGPGRPIVQKAMVNTPQNTNLKKSPAVANKPGLEKKKMPIGPTSKKHDWSQRKELHGLPKAMVSPRQPTASKPQQSKQQSSFQLTPHQPNYSSKPQQPKYSSKPQQPSSSNAQRTGYLTNPQQSGYSSKPQQSGTSLKPQQSGALLKPQQQGHSSKVQPSKISKPLLKKGTNGHQMKRKPMTNYSDEDDNAISMIRQMFRYNPNRYQDSDDDSDMEANFDDIMMEERRSSIIARREDEEQLRLIEEEERREKMRKMAKKRKLR